MVPACLSLGFLLCFAGFNPSQQTVTQCLPVCLPLCFLWRKPALRYPPSLLPGLERGSAETLAPLPVVGSVNGRPSHSTANPRVLTGCDLSSLGPWPALGGGWRGVEVEKPLLACPQLQNSQCCVHHCQRTYLWWSLLLSRLHISSVYCWHSHLYFQSTLLPWRAEATPCVPAGISIRSEGKAGWPASSRDPPISILPALRMWTWTFRLVCRHSTYWTTSPVANKSWKPISLGGFDCFYVVIFFSPS